MSGPTRPPQRPDIDAIEKYAPQTALDEGLADVLAWLHHVEGENQQLRDTITEWIAAEDDNDAALNECYATSDAKDDEGNERARDRAKETQRRLDDAWDALRAAGRAERNPGT